MEDAMETYRKMEDTAVAGMPETPELRTYLQLYRAIQAEAQELVAGLTEAQFNGRVAPGTWSVGECLEHLNVAGYLLLPGLDKGIRRGRARKQFARGPFRYGPVSRWFIRAMRPTGRRMSSPKVFAPGSALARDEVVDRFMALQEALMERVRAADGLDLKRIIVPSAVTPLLRISLGAWFESTAIHEQRHLAQARRVLEQL